MNEEKSKKMKTSTRGGWWFKDKAGRTEWKRGLVVCVKAGINFPVIHNTGVCVRESEKESK